MRKLWRFIDDQTGDHELQRMFAMRWSLFIQACRPFHPVCQLQELHQAQFRCPGGSGTEEIARSRRSPSKTCFGATPSFCACSINIRTNTLHAVGDKSVRNDHVVFVPKTQDSQYEGVQVIDEQDVIRKENHRRRSSSKSA